MLLLYHDKLLCQLYLLTIHQLCDVGPWGPPGQVEHKIYISTRNIKLSDERTSHVCYTELIKRGDLVVNDPDRAVS